MSKRPDREQASPQLVTADVAATVAAIVAARVMSPSDLPAIWPHGQASADAEWCVFPSVTASDDREIRRALARLGVFRFRLGRVRWVVIVPGAMRAPLASGPGAK